MIGGPLRLGVLADFLSRPVLDGFVVGVAITVVAGQLDKMLGYPLAEVELAFVPDILVRLAGWEPGNYLKMLRNLAKGLIFAAPVPALAWQIVETGSMTSPLNHCPICRRLPKVLAFWNKPHDRGDMKDTMNRKRLWKLIKE